MAEENNTNVEEMVSEKESKEGYKKTKLGWIPDDWIFVKLGNITTKIGSGSTPRGGEKVYTKKGVPFLRSQNVNNNILDLTKEIFIPESVHKSMKGTIVKSNDILLNITGASIGRSCVVPLTFKEGNVNQHVSIIRLKESVANNKFIQAYLSSFHGQKAIIKAQVGGNREGLNHSSIRLLSIPFPSNSEQKAIANCLNTWDNVIQNVSSLIDEKKLQKKALMQQLLTGKKRLKGFSGEWQELIFSDFVKRVNRKNAELNDTVVTISAQRGFVLQEDFFNKRVASDTLLNYTLVHRGEYCYNKSYSNGYPMGAFKRLDAFDKAVVTTLYICFSLKDNVDSDYMNQYFDAGKMIPELMKIAQEGGRAHGLLNIGLSDFFSLPVTIPYKEEQTAIANVLQQADKEITLLNKKLDLLKEQKKGLMQQLLTGKKRLKF